MGRSIVIHVLKVHLKKHNKWLILKTDNNKIYKNKCLNDLSI